MECLFEKISWRTEQHLFEIEIFWHIISGFTVTFDLLNFLFLKKVLPVISFQNKSHYIYIYKTYIPLIYNITGMSILRKNIM